MIKCTHILDMDHLDVKHLNSLQSLELYRVRISFDHLLSIAEQNKSTLRSVFVWYVELKSGTWTDVLLGLCQLPQLVSFPVDSAGYAKAGDSSKWTPRLLPKIDDPQEHRDASLSGLKRSGQRRETRLG
jgi:hypothetical protein